MRSFRAWRLAAVTLLATLVSSMAVAAVDPLIIDRVEIAIAEGKAAQGLKLLEDTIRSSETTQEERVDLLGHLAMLRMARAEFADAGEALALQAELHARLKGARAPELAAIYAAASDAYALTTEIRKALELARNALAIDRAYLDCAGETVAGDHARIAGLLTRLGQPDQAAAEKKLAIDSLSRCSSLGSKIGTRGVVVTTELAATTPNSFTRVKVFYATDRARTGSERPNDFYGSDRGQLEYGTLEVTVPRIHKPGNVEAPSMVKLEWSENPERHFVLSRIETKTGDEMFADMKATLAERKADEAFVFIHGFNVPFVDAAKQTAQIAYDLNFTGAPILYSWPSAGSAFSYIRDEAVVRLSGRRLLGFLDDLVARSGARKVNLIAHSMGNRALLDALELMSVRRAGAGKSGPVFEQVIFAAPDEDSLLFTEMMKDIRPIARRLTLYGSDNDVALGTSKRLHGDQPRAGQAGASIVISKALDSIDMSILGGDMLGHGYFANTASALTDMLWLFWQDAPPEKRCGMNGKDAPPGRFWMYDPTRCDGAVMLSALTMLKTEGQAAVTRLDKLLADTSAEKPKADEWKAIRAAILVFSAEGSSTLAAPRGGAASGPPKQ